MSLVGLCHSDKCPLVKQEKKEDCPNKPQITLPKFNTTPYPTKSKANFQLPGFGAHLLLSKENSFIILSEKVNSNQF